MRTILAGLLLSTALAAPALAQSRDQAQAQAVAKALQNPMVQEGIAGMVGELAGIVLDTRVGALARYTDPEEGIRAGDTLRDLQRRRDPGFETRLHDNTRRAIGTAGAAAEDALAMGASVEETAARLRAALEPLRRALESYRGD
ncbi:MAG: hypothetical protein EOP61_10980 [Sphingomonadales bacterium]|nr:MAG: hypothetical protein EOP61_10980 [Sphingomonadales bacterium]